MAALLFRTCLTLLLFLAFLLLALTQFQHRRATGAAELSARRAARVRLAAAVLLILALVITIRQEGGGFGSLLWVGLMSLAACAVTLLLAWWPRLFSPLARLLMLSPFPVSPTGRALRDSGERFDRYSE